MNPPVTAAADDLLAQLVRRHFGRVADFTERLRAAGFSPEQPPCWSTLARVAPRAKSELAALQATRADFGGLGPAGGRAPALFWSPGGLMEPLVGATVTRLAQQLQAAGFGEGDRVANGFAYHYTPAGLLFHEALVRIGATVLPIGPQQTAQAAEFIARAQATGFVGTASHLRALMQAVDALPADIARAPMRHALAGAEPFGDALRREIESRWGIACLDFYGTAESGIVALECPQHAGLHLHPGVLAELVDPASGQRSADAVGELLLSADADELPLLRFATGDLVRLDDRPCACGLATPRLQPLGRVGDSARVRGMLLHASQLRAFARAAGLDACHATLTRAAQQDHIAVRYRAAADTPPTEAALAEAFRNTCRLRADGFAADATLAPNDFVLADQRHATP